MDVSLLSGDVVSQGRNDLRRLHPGMVMKNAGQRHGSECRDGESDAGGTAHRPQVLFPLRAVLARRAAHEYSMPSD